MPLIEEIDDVEDAESIGGPSGSADLLRSLHELTARLRLSENLSNATEDDQFSRAIQSYQDSVVHTLRQMLASVEQSSWIALSLEEQSEIILDLVRLYGDDPWACPQITSLIDDITAPLDQAGIAIILLAGPIRDLFSPTQHPLLNSSSSRALARPAGGSEAHADFHETSSQIFKSPLSGWGCYNVLSWCCLHLTASLVEQKIGLIIPPTLVMMDDWEPVWRERGIKVLASWIDKFSVEMMRRMGLDSLVLKSLIHTLSLHSNPPIRNALPMTIKLVKMMKMKQPDGGENKADIWSEIIDKYLIAGWMYTTSARESRPVLIDLSEGVMALCEVLGSGIARWLKTIIPALLQPLQFTPSPVVLEHYLSNVTALNKVIITLRDTNRIPRWRGQIVDVLSRLWIQLQDRSADFQVDSSDRVTSAKILDTIAEIFVELQYQYPAISEEYKKLLVLDRDMFAPLIPSSA